MMTPSEFAAIKEAVKIKLSINRCPIHPHYWMISIDDENGGERITPSKCCGSWEQIESWPLTKADCAQAIRVFKEANRRIKK